MQQQQKQNIGNYKLGKTIGRGTFAKVKLATHLITEEIVAIKILDKAKIQDEEDKTRIIRELEILRKIRHPNIIQLYQVLETQEYIYIVIEYAERGQLFKLITSQQKLKEKVAARIFIQLINAIQYLHKLNITHRDLKPQNVLLDFDYNIKLIDFGLSNYYNVGELLSTACGSPCYAPPEMVSGKKYDGYMSDIWSMGIIFYVMVCGFLPFQEQTTKQLYKKIIVGQYELPEFLSQKSKQVIKKILVTDPLQRIKLNQLRKLQLFEELKQEQPQIIGIIVGHHPMPIDLELLNSMKKKINDLDIKTAEEYIRSNRHNHITTTYYLLQKKILREGGKTIVDLQIYLQSNSQYKNQFIKNEVKPLKTEKKSKSRDSISKYQKINKSIMKKKRQNKKLDSNNKTEIVNKAKNNMTLKLNKSNLKKQQYKIPSQRKRYYTEQKNKTQDIQTTSLTKTTRKSSQKKPLKQKNLGIKLWDAYFKNSLQLKLLKGKGSLILKDKQRQNIFKQNLKKLKQGFFKFPQVNKKKSKHSAQS